MCPIAGSYVMVRRCSYRPKSNINKKSRLIRTPRKLSVAETYITIAFMLCALIVLYAIVGWDLKITLLLVLAFNVFMGWRIGTPFKNNGKIHRRSYWQFGVLYAGIVGNWFSHGNVYLFRYHSRFNFLVGTMCFPSIVLLLCLILPSILSVAVISSFATLGTLGIIMFSVATMCGVPPGLAAAACICGANFGQYFSPLGDTTNLCAQVNGISIQRFMKGFSIPFGISFVITAIVFFILGNMYVSGSGTGSDIAVITDWVHANFNTSVLVLLPFVVAIVLALLKVHAIIFDLWHRCYCYDSRLYLCKVLVLSIVLMQLITVFPLIL